MWTAIRLPNSFVSDAKDSVTIETLDGDGVRVTYEQAQDPTSNSGQAFGYVVPGSESAPLVIRGGDQVIETRFPDGSNLGEGPSLIPLQTPWIVALGDTLGIESIGVSELLGRKSSVVVTVPQSATSLPDRSVGYDGVNLMLINQTGLPLLREMSEAQQDAVQEWVRQGGRIFLTLGASVPEFVEAAPWLIDMLPIGDPSVVRLDPSVVESLVSSQTQLRVFRGAQLPRKDGRVLLTGRNSRRVLAAFASEYSIGFGRVTVLAADLDQDPFATWPDRLELIQRLVEGVFPTKEIQSQAAGQATSFDDLAGQMRGTLDQFGIKRSFGFSFLAIILMLLITAVGPIDYLLVNRFWGKPLLGWLSLPLMIIGLSGLLIMQSRPVDTTTSAGTSEAGETPDSGPPSSSGERSSEESVSGKSMSGDSSLVAVNQFQVVDLDWINNGARAFSWSYLYTHHAGTFDLDYSPSDDAKQLISTSDWTRCSPFGHPGREFGGIQLAGENRLLPPYRINTNSSSEGQQQSVQGLALAPRSSKSMSSRSRFEPKALDHWGVYRKANSEQLRGELVNPLPFDIVNGMLVFGNNVYMLPGRFRKGAVIPNVEKLRQRNFRRRLARQQALEKNMTETEAWTSGNFQSPRRVAEMLMFHNAAGGKVYTGLTHLPLASLDLSHVLVNDQCMLVGETERPLFELNVRSRADGLETAGDRTTKTSGNALSLIRVLLPLHVGRPPDKK